MAGGEEAFSEVAADYLFGIADGGEVGAGVPLVEEIEVEGELVVERGRRGVKKIGGEESGDLVGGHGTSLAGCSTWNIRLGDLASLASAPRNSGAARASNSGNVSDNLGDYVRQQGRKDEPSHQDCEDRERGG
jgi:hypothetical protein